jgi:hypothetical protein
MRGNAACAHMAMRAQPHLFTMIAASSMIQLAPITMGPAMAKMVAFGCTMVPVHTSDERKLNCAFSRSNTGANGDIAFELNILAYNSLGVNREFISAKSIELRCQTLKGCVWGSHRGHATDQVKVEVRCGQGKVSCVR